MGTDETQDQRARRTARVAQEQDDVTQERALVAAFEESDINGHAIDWRYWIEHMPTLNAAQAARLMSALDPDVHGNVAALARPKENTVSKRRLKALKIERLATEHGRERDSPEGWFLWARGLGLKMHDGFVLAVEPAGRLAASTGYGLPKAAVPEPSHADVAGQSESTTPRTLTTPQMAEAFDGELELSAKHWRRRMGDTPKWLEPARAAKGTPPEPSTWLPLNFARILLERGASSESLNHKFVNVLTLKPWLLEWQKERREKNAFGQ